MKTVKWVIAECGPTWDSLEGLITLDEFRKLKPGKLIEVEDESASQLIERGFCIAVDAGGSDVNGNVSVH